MLRCALKSEILEFLGNVAPDFSYLAETCREMSSIVRLFYCKHCGRRMRDTDFKHIVGGRASHTYPCDWPDELDPFRSFYPLLKDFDFVIGGSWATWIHFREHRLHINPWVKGRALANRNLNIYCTGETENQRLSSILCDTKQDLPVILIKETDRRYVSCNVHFTLAPKSKPHFHFIVIVNDYSVSNCCNVIESAINSFGLSCCRVAFSLHWSPKTSIPRRICHMKEDGSPFNHFQGPRYPRGVVLTENRLQHKRKYIDRGYTHLECDCFYQPNNRGRRPKKFTKQISSSHP